MKRKALISLAALIIIVITIALNKGHAPNKYNCPFCDENILGRQRIYEDPIALVLYTHKPVMPGHCLIIPKRHVERFEELTEEESAQLCRLIKKVDSEVSAAFETSSYLLLQKNGRESGQSVPHVHIHYIPRKSGDSSALKFVTKLFWTNFKKPISEKAIQQAIHKIQHAKPKTQVIAD